MATVITNLLSAIPIFGRDLVELIWTLISNKINETNFEYLNNILVTNTLKTNSNLLNPIGKINWKKIRNISPLTDKYKERLLSIPASYLGRLAGFIDGDGYIAVVASDAVRKYASIWLKIELIHTDLDMLTNIKNTLGIGRINGPYKNSKGEFTVSLTFSKTELQLILFPLFFYHGIFFLTLERRLQISKAIFLMETGLNKMSDLPLIIPLSTYLPSLPINGLDYLKLSFFKSWLVGFTIAEGSFFTKNNLDSCFQLKQRIHEELFIAFRLLFNTTTKITIDKNKYAQFAVSSKKDIQTVINFFSFSNNPLLLGNKLIQYKFWINSLKNSKRYSKLNLPE